MKRFLLLIGLVVVFASCKTKTKTFYDLVSVGYVPDSLKIEHREWIKETIRAASQHMTGGDYEDVDLTIRQAKWTADELFGVDETVLRIKRKISGWNNNSIEYFLVRQSELTEEQKKIFNSLNK